MHRTLRLAAAAVALALTALLGAGPASADDGLGNASARAAYAQIEGSGSTWSEVIVQQWISDVDALGMKVTYNGGGSSQGRKNFAQNVTDFGISEIPYPASTSSAMPTTATAASSPTCRSSPAAPPSPTSSRSATSWCATSGCRGRR